MNKMNERMLRRSRVGNSFRFMGAVVLLAIFAGCAVVGKPEPEPSETVSAPAEQAALVPAGPIVSRFADGREGFVITEPPVLDLEARRDFERAIALMNDQENEQAVVLLEKVVGKNPGVSAPYVNLAIACRHLGRSEEAEQHLKTALELVPGHPAAGNEYGLLLRRAGRFAEARQVYEKTITAFPEYSPAHRNLGILCDLYMNDQACALEQYETYSAAVPGDEQVRMWIADLRVRMGKL